MKVRIEIDMENDAFQAGNRMRELKRVMDTARELCVSVSYGNMKATSIWHALM